MHINQKRSGTDSAVFRPTSTFQCSLVVEWTEVYDLIYIIDVYSLVTLWSPAYLALTFSYNVI